MTEKTTHIYGIKDPFTNKFVYVGKSNYPDLRYVQHNEEWHKFSRNFNRGKWWDSVVARGGVPVLVILDTMSQDESVWKPAEQYWIKYFRDLNHPLFNKANGGQDSSYEGNGWKPYVFSGQFDGKLEFN